VAAPVKKGRRTPERPRDPETASRRELARPWHMPTTPPKRRASGGFT
jgi:hypothetical protein